MKKTSISKYPRYTQFVQNLLNLFKIRSERNKNMIREDEVAQEVFGDLERRIAAFLRVATEVKKGRKRTRKNSKIFKKAEDAFTFPKDFTFSFEEEVLFSWKFPEKVLLLSIIELKKRNSYPGLGNELCTSGTRDDEVLKAGRIGFALASSKTPQDFFGEIKKRNLLEL